MPKKTGLVIFRLTIDIFASACAFFLAIFLRFEFRPSFAFFAESFLPFFVYTAILLMLNAALGNYSFNWVHVSIIEALRVIMASGLAFVAIFLLHITGLLSFSLSLAMIYLSLFTLLSEILRFSIRSAYVLRKFFGIYAHSENIKNVLVVADWDTGGLILRRLLQGKQMRFRPLAILTAPPTHQRNLLGVKVFSDRSALPQLLSQLQIDEIVLQADHFNARDIAWLKLECDHQDVEIKIFQGLQTMNSSAVSSFRPLKIEDLLGRNEIKLNKTWIDAFIAGKRVLVTGAAGSIGSEICRQCLAFRCKTLFLLDFNENGLYELELHLKEISPETEIIPILASIRDERRLKAIFDRCKPEVVFHAAAHKHVPMMESNPCEAIKNNVFGTLNVLQTCEEYEVRKLIIISSDKAVNPSSVMGATKRVTEMLVQAYGRDMKTEVAAVRFGNVLGSNGSVVPIFQRQIAQGGPVTVMHRDIERYFMTISEAVQLVMQTGALASRGEIFVFNMGRSVKIYDLACEMIRLSGYEPNKDIDISIIGLRPGEKLFEELRLDLESMDSTKHESIFVCKPLVFDGDKLKTQLSYLAKALLSENETAAVEYLFSLVPSIYRKPSMTSTPIIFEEAIP